MVTLRLAPLHKKLLRDLWRMKWQALAIAMLIGAGVAVTVMAFSAQEALRSARNAYYRSARFADVFVTLKRAPLSVARRVAAIEGVTGCDARIVYGGLSAIPGLVRPAMVRLVSLPDQPSAALNRIVITRGRAPGPGRLREAVVLQTFLDAAGLRLGDQVHVTAGGRLLSFTIVGTALSPEFIYLPSPASIMPDNAHTGVLWVHRRALEGAAKMEGAFNALSMTLAAGAQSSDIERRLSGILEPYGMDPIVFRADQPSNAFLEGEFEELAHSGATFSPIFLIVAGALVNMVMARLVEVQREQIGLLKAFGYSNAEASRPFALLAGAIALIGVAIGVGLGTILARAITNLYAQHMRFPGLEPRFHLAAFTAASLIACVACLAGALSAVRAAARLSPAIAMSPPRPTRFKPALIERLSALMPIGVGVRLTARNLERRPLRAGLTLLGLAAAISLLLGTQFLFGAMDLVMEHTFYRRQVFSHQITFVEPRAMAAIAETRRLPGVLSIRAVRSAEVTLANGRRAERIALTGIDPAEPYLRMLDSRDRPIPLRGGGLIMTEALERKLGIGPGDRVRVRLHAGRRREVMLPVTALATDYSGLTAVMDRRDLNALLNEGDLANAAQAIVDPARADAFYRAVAETPGIAGAMSRDDTVKSYRVIVAQAFRTSRMYYAAFAAIIAFGVAYNAGRISFSERARDLATLEVLGFTHAEIAWIQLGELALLAVLAAPIGLAGGWALAHGLAFSYQRDEMRIPAVIDASALGMTFLVYGATILTTLALIGYRLWRLDLVAVLKTRE